MPNPSPPALAVVVPATDRPATLSRCLAALNASADPADDLIVVREPAGGGPAEARNRGVGATDAEIVVFVDSDVEVHPDALDRIRAAFAADPSPDAVFGAYDDAPAASGQVSRFRNLLHHHVHVSAAGEAETFWAGLGAVRRDRFAAAGGFDPERYPAPAVEDIDLGMRMHGAGARIVLDPDIRGKHLKRWSLVSMLRTDFARRGIPWSRLLLERREASASLNLSLANRASGLAAVVFAAAAAALRPRPALAALFALVTINRRFYALLLRRGGPGLLAAGVPLHVLHHLAGAASIPAAVVLHLREERA